MFLVQVELLKLDKLMRVLLAEDEPHLAAVLLTALRNNNIIADHASTLEAAQEAIRINSYDAVLLDRTLPDGEGLELIEAARRVHQAIPVIILTARGDVKDRIEGLDFGADDYLAKPFAVEELLARLRAIMRRPGTIGTGTVCLGQLQFDLHNREARVGNVLLALPRRELLALEALVRRSGRTVERSTLEEAVYGMDDEIQSNALDAHVSRVRRKLDAAGAEVEIHTIRGIGYLLRQARR